MELVPQLRQRTLSEIADLTVQQDIIELLGTILTSKFSHLSRQEIEAMFLVNDLKQTKVYQEAKAEGWQEGKHEGKQEGRQEGRQNEARLLLLRLLSKRFGALSDRQLQAIHSLSLAQLEELGEVLLDFQALSELDRWLMA
jgi:predicted transposase YdaD